MAPELRNLHYGLLRWRSARALVTSSRGFFLDRVGAISRITALPSKPRSRSRNFRDLPKLWMENYLPILVFAVIAVLFLVVSLTAARLFRHGGRGATNREPYECGNEPDTLAHDHRFSVRFYLIAVLFVVFDVETIFLFPWAVMFDKLALFGFIEMIVFLLILVIGYAYVWRRGALNWA